MKRGDSLLDVYVCECEREFAVQEGLEPNCCPFCHGPEIQFEREVEL